MVKDALDKGAKIVVGSEPGEEKEGNVLQPVVLDGITKDMGEFLLIIRHRDPRTRIENPRRVVRCSLCPLPSSARFSFSFLTPTNPLLPAIHSEEIFGPALGIIHFSSDAEAISIANSLEYGLSGAVHSRDVERARNVAGELEINLVHVNSFTLHDSDVSPFLLWGRGEVEGTVRRAGTLRRGRKELRTDDTLPPPPFSLRLRWSRMADGRRVVTDGSTASREFVSSLRRRYVYFRSLPWARRAVMRLMWTGLAYRRSRMWTWMSLLSLRLRFRLELEVKGRKQLVINPTRRCDFLHVNLCRTDY